MKKAKATKDEPEEKEERRRAKDLMEEYVGYVLYRDWRSGISDYQARS